MTLQIMFLTLRSHHPLTHLLTLQSRTPRRIILTKQEPITSKIPLMFQKSPTLTTTPMFPKSPTLAAPLMFQRSPALTIPPMSLESLALTVPPPLQSPLTLIVLLPNPGFNPWLRRKSPHTLPAAGLSGNRPQKKKLRPMSKLISLSPKDSPVLSRERNLLPLIMRISSAA